LVHALDDALGHAEERRPRDRWARLWCRAKRSCSGCGADAFGLPW